MARITLISDNDELSRELTAGLEKRGHGVVSTECLEPRISQAIDARPDLLIVDFGSMSREFVAACQNILDRPELKCSVLGLFGALNEPRDVLSLLSAADTLARKAIASQSKPGAGEYGFMKLDVHRREVVIRGNSIALTPSETHILSILAARAGSYVSAKSIVSEMHGCEVSEREAGDIIRVHIHNLRRKFQKIGGPPYILSSRGKGYLLERRTRPARA